MNTDIPLDRTTVVGGTRKSGSIFGGSRGKSRASGYGSRFRPPLTILGEIDSEDDSRTRASSLSTNTEFGNKVGPGGGGGADFQVVLPMLAQRASLWP